MGTRSRRTARSEGVREARAIAGNLGRELRRTRRARRLRQVDVADRVGLSQAEISALESGGGSRTSIETWVAIGVALRRPVAISFSRDGVQPLNDAGHLEAQELVLRLATAAGWAGAFEVPSRPDEPRHSSDLVLRRAGETVLVEIWNRLDDLGAAVRSTDRKVAELANDRLVECWLLVDTVANRAIVRRYPTILRSRFPESSAALVRAISQAAPLPRRSAAAWIDLRAAMLRPLRLHR